MDGQVYKNIIFKKKTVDMDCLMLSFKMIKNANKDEKYYWTREVMIKIPTLSPMVNFTRILTKRTWITVEYF